MRRILAAAALAAAALTTTAPAASAACVGARDYATVCYRGSLTPTIQEEEVCVYTGGDECEPVMVPMPYFEEIDLSKLEVCVGRSCLAN